MNNRQGASAYRELMEAARADGPSEAQRACVWAAVSEALSPSGCNSGNGSNGGPLAGASAKLLTVGTWLGATISVGLAMALLCLRASSAPLHPLTGSARTNPPRAEADLAQGAPATKADIPLGPAESLIQGPPGDRAAVTVIARHTHCPASNGTGPGDSLGREALLLTRARIALARGDAASAVADLRAAEHISGRQLVPEELSLESQALRVLGRDREADAQELELRSRYPESALAR
jgi:hypothetical protein